MRLAAAIAALLLTLVGDVRAAQFRVCAFVFNTPHELAAIKSQLSPKDFELKMQMAHLALQLAWISEDEFRRLAVEGAKQLLAEPLSSEVVDIACELTKYVTAGAGLRSEEIPEQLFWHSEGFRMLDCLSPADARLSTSMLAGLDSIDESTRLWAAYALSRRLPLDDTVLKALARRLNDPSAGVRQRVQWIFEAQSPLSADVLAAIREREPALVETLEARSQKRQ